MATKADTKKESADLTPQQLTAVDQLATGATVTAAAEAVGVARQTVSEWLNQQAAFQAALNQRRAELWVEQSDRLRALLPAALETVEKSLKQGGAGGLKAALALIRMAGLELTPTGATDREEIEVEAARRKTEMMWRRISAESPLG